MRETSQQPRGMKQSEIRPCAVCKKGIAQRYESLYARVVGAVEKP